MILTDAGKHELAIALILLRDFKSQGRFDPALALQMLEFAKHLGILPEYESMLSQIPPMKIEPR